MSDSKKKHEQLIRENEELRQQVAAFQTNPALIASELRYRRLFENAKDGILILDAETGLIVDVNPFLTKLTGYSREDFLTKHLWDVGPFKDLAASKISFEELQAKEYIRYEDLPLETRDGRKIDVEFVSNVHQVDETKVIQCNFREITERKRAEARLRDSEERFRLAAQAATDVIYERDMRTGLAVYYGGDIDGILGFPPGGFPRDLEGISDLVHPDDATVVAKAFLEYQATGKPYRVELRVRRADGGYNTFIDKACLVYDEKGLPLKWIGACTDITEKVHAEAALREHQKKLKEQNDLLQQRSAALRELVEQLKTEQKTLEAKVRANIDQLIRPVLQNAKEATRHPKVKGYLEIIDKNLGGITSSFGTAIENEWDSLSRREVEVSHLIRDGLSSKRIAELLGISDRSVTAHRRNIRRKLGLKARKINLSTYLRKFK